MAAPSASSASAGPRRQSRLPPRAAWRTSSAAWRRLEGEREGVWREKGGEWREDGERVGEMRGKKRQQTTGKGPWVASRAGPRAFFACAGSPSAPRAPGSAWVRRHQFWPEPAKNGLLGRYWGVFLVPARQNRLGRACWGRGWRCP